MGLIWKQSNMLLTNYNKKKNQTDLLYVQVRPWLLEYSRTKRTAQLPLSTLVAALTQCSHIFLYRLSLIPFHPQSSVLNITR